MAYWIEYFAYLNPNMSMAWRTPLALQIIFIIIIGAGINFFPESPRWLMKVGREDEARNVLKATRDSDVEYELKGIKQVVKFELETSTANHYWAMLFPKDKYARQLRWRVVLAVWLQIMQELVGIGVSPTPSKINPHLIRSTGHHSLCGGSISGCWFRA